MSDEKKPDILPVRHGPAQGHAVENRMIGAVGGPNSIRTKIIDNVDGSKTMLRTRGGMPEITTEGTTKDEVAEQNVWPWHGYYDYADSTLKVEKGATTTSKTITFALPNNQNCFTFKKPGASYKSVPPGKKGRKPYLDWVNYGILGGNTLFGVDVGNTVWPVVMSNGKVYVVDCAISGITSVTLTVNLYRLDDWVKHNSTLPTKALYFKNNKKLNPFSTRTLPSGGTLTAVMTQTINVPAYTGSGTLSSFRRGDISHDGSHAVFIRQCTYTNLGVNVFNDDAWYELRITQTSGVLTAALVTLRDTPISPNSYGTTSNVISYPVGPMGDDGHGNLMGTITGTQVVMVDQTLDFTIGFYYGPSSNTAVEWTGKSQATNNRTSTHTITLAGGNPNSGFYHLDVTGSDVSKLTIDYGSGTFVIKSTTNYHWTNYDTSGYVNSTSEVGTSSSSISLSPFNPGGLPGTTVVPTSYGLIGTTAIAALGAPSSSVSPYSLTSATANRAWSGRQNAAERCAFGLQGMYTKFPQNLSTGHYVGFNDGYIGIMRDTENCFTVRFYAQPIGGSYFTGANVIAHLTPDGITYVTAPPSEGLTSTSTPATASLGAYWGRVSYNRAKKKFAYGTYSSGSWLGRYYI